MGAVSGTQLMVRDAHFVSPVSTPMGSVAQIFVTDYPGACTAAPTPYSLKGIGLLDLLVVNLDAGMPVPLVVGDYAVVSRNSNVTNGTFANVSFSKLDNTCRNTLAATGVPGTSGTVHLSTVSAGTINGTFDVTFSSGHLNGSFMAGGCAPPMENGSICN
jgi:hypothetical protein